MRVVARAAVLGLAGLMAFGAAGCNRGGGSGGTTTIIQQPGGGNAGTPSLGSSAAPVSVTPIDDQKELCHQVLSKTRGLSNALNAFWKIATNGSTWSFADPSTGDAVNRVQKEYEQVFPSLESIVGKNAPADTADAVNDYFKTMKAFSNVITEQRKNDDLDPAASAFGHAKDKLNDICSATG